MVSSKINTSVNYPEIKTLDPEDKGHSSSLYIIEVLDKEIIIVLGKPKYAFSNKGIVYYPIYVVSDEKIKSQIGVYEHKISNTISLLDEDGDVDIEKLGNPLLYSFVTKKYLEKSESNPGKYMDAELKKEAIQNEKHFEDIVSKKDEPKEETDEDDVMKLKVNKSKISEQKTAENQTLEKGIFTINTNFKPPSQLEEETEEIANKIKNIYKESSANNWIQKFMKNDQYKIQDVESQGDCFFAVVREAFSQIGQNTSVLKLRTLLSSKVTDEIYQERKNLYNQFETRKEELKRELKDYKQANAEFIKRMKTVTDKQEKEKIVEETKRIKSAYDTQMIELKELEKTQSEYIGYMKTVDSYEKFKEFILTSSYWADEWAISTLEYLLNIKVIILAEEAYNEKAYDNILNCGEICKEITQTNNSISKKFDPTHYIITTYSGNHYRLVTYKNKSIFAFSEIPYDIKILIINKCLEKNSGVYYLIQDFRNFKTQFGIDADEGDPEMEEEESDGEGNVSVSSNTSSSKSSYYNKSTVFTFHGKALNTPKPGKGANEKIDKERVSEFAGLSKIKDWRRKLDDSWAESQFTIDGKKWASVVHYMEGSKYRKGFPDFYAKFSLDEPSEISKDPEVAKHVGDIRKSKYKEMRPQGVKMDPDYNLGRKDTERELALKSKFTQNEDLKQMLKMTKDALLQIYNRRSPPTKDHALMKVRAEL
jgi:predicted NAD-dependent protein-ADP-ribosyltransferase YbiA (DUF1768 family)